MVTGGGLFDDDQTLALFCRIAMRRGHSARSALEAWRANGGHVSNEHFYAVWNHQKATVLR